MMVDMSTGERGRLPALDGLRGVAALVVVVTHALLTDARWATSWLGVPANAGRAAVMVFFVLSGYVLVRPFVAGRGKAWRVYYPARMVRLYLPVWGALVFAAALAALVPRVGGTGNWWLDFQAVPATWRTLVEHGTLWAPGEFLNPLWSLKWEVAFSLLLPLYVAAARRARRWLPGAFLVLGVVHAGAWVAGVEAVAYLTVFGFGSLLAVSPRVSGSRWWVAGSVGAVVALTANLLPLQVAGATLLVASVLWCARVGEAFSAPPLLWLGRVSFSLYLVHVPVILALYAAGGAAVSLVAGVPLSLVVAVGAFRLVEGPAQRLASRFGVERHRVERDEPVPACQYDNGTIALDVAADGSADRLYGEDDVPRGPVADREREDRRCLTDGAVLH